MAMLALLLALLALAPLGEATSVQSKYSKKKQPRGREAYATAGAKKRLALSSPGWQPRLRPGESPSKNPGPRPLAGLNDEHPAFDAAAAVDAAVAQALDAQDLLSPAAAAVSAGSGSRPRYAADPTVTASNRRGAGAQLAPARGERTGDAVGLHAGREHQAGAVPLETTRQQPADPDRNRRSAQDQTGGA